MCTQDRSIFNVFLLFSSHVRHTFYIKNYETCVQHGVFFCYNINDDETMETTEAAMNQFNLISQLEKVQH